MKAEDAAADDDNSESTGFIDVSERREPADGSASRCCRTLLVARCCRCMMGLGPQQCEMAVGGKSEVSRPGNFARQQARRHPKKKLGVRLGRR